MTDRLIKGILFDLDGVLVDATEWHYRALNRALGLFGFGISRYDHLSTYNGLPTKKKLEMLTLEKGLPDGLHPLINHLKQIYTREEIAANCRPMFDKEYMTARLARDGYRMAVCSNAVRSSAELMLQQSGLRPYFELVLANEDIAKPKPAPDVYVAAMKTLGLSPSEVAIVEDAPPGVEAARRSGAHVCHVRGIDDVDYFRVTGFINDIGRQAVVS